MTVSWTNLTLRLNASERARSELLNYASLLGRHVETGGAQLDEADVEALRRSFLRSLRGLAPQTRVRIEAYVCVLADLAKQGWQIRLQGEQVEGLRPESHLDTAREAKRRQLASRRNEQLREPATRTFVFSMERGHIHRGRRVSIFSLFRDGRELATTIDARRRSAADDPEATLPIKPYVQIAERPGTCEHTGFELTDIWRYFRHTWSTPYEKCARTNDANDHSRCRSP